MALLVHRLRNSRRLIVSSWLQLTNRVTINYPQRQKYVVRVRPSIVLSDLFQMAVDQRNLDPARYELRHPAQPGVVLDLTAPLSQYGITEVTVVEKQPTSPGESRQNSTHSWPLMFGFRQNLEVKTPRTFTAQCVDFRSLVKVDF